MNKAILIMGDDWEGLFINGKLVEEGHSLNEGISRVKYFNNLCKEYNFKLSDLQEAYMNGEGEDYLYDEGCFSNEISKIDGLYEITED